MNKVILGLMLLSIMILALLSVNQNQILAQDAPPKKKTQDPCRKACDDKWNACILSHRESNQDESTCNKSGYDCLSKCK